MSTKFFTLKFGHIAENGGLPKRGRTTKFILVRAFNKRRLLHFFEKDKGILALASDWANWTIRFKLFFNLLHLPIPIRRFNSIHIHNLLNTAEWDENNCTRSGHKVSHVQYTKTICM